MTIAGSRKSDILKELKTRLQSAGFKVYLSTLTKQPNSLYLSPRGEQVRDVGGARELTGIQERVWNIDIFTDFSTSDEWEAIERLDSVEGEIRAAVELDEDLGGLVLNYGLVETEFISTDDGRWVLKLGYEFTYLSTCKS